MEGILRASGDVELVEKRLRDYEEGQGTHRGCHDSLLPMFACLTSAASILLPPTAHTAPSLCAGHSLPCSCYLLLSHTPPGPPPAGAVCACGGTAAGEQEFDEGENAHVIGDCVKVCLSGAALGPLVLGPMPRVGAGGGVPRVHPWQQRLPWEGTRR